MQRRVAAALCVASALAGLGGTIGAGALYQSTENSLDPMVRLLLVAYAASAAGMLAAGASLFRGWQWRWTTALVTTSVFALVVLAGLTVLAAGFLMLPAAVLGIAALVVSLYVPDNES